MAATQGNQEDPEKVRNATFQRIGRNVVNLQRMERLLKFLLVFGDICAPKSQLKAHIKARKKRFSKCTLGELIKIAPQAIFASETRRSTVPTDIKEPWVSFFFEVEAGKEAIQEWHKQISFVVKERNRLIHGLLGPYHPQSIKSCRALDAKLEKQSAQIEIAYKSVASMVVAVREVFADFAAGKGEEVF
jgi:hypothetical protein